MWLLGAERSVARKPGRCDRAQRWVRTIFLRQQWPWQRPIDGEIGIVPGDAAFGLTVIEACELIDHNSAFASDLESVGKALRNDKYPGFVGRECYADPATERRRPNTDVEHH